MLPCERKEVLPYRMLILITALLALASAASAQDSGPLLARQVYVRIETDRPLYSIGDTIRLRLTLRNTSRDTVRTSLRNHTALVRLQVYDGDGHPLKETLPLVPGEGGGPGMRLSPGTEVTIGRFRDAEWFDLGDWGYHPQLPGEYVLIGCALIDRPTRAPGSTERSNQARFTISPWDVRIGLQLPPNQRMQPTSAPKLTPARAAGADGDSGTY